MPLASLKMGLNRIDEAKASLRSQSAIQEDNQTACLHKSLLNVINSRYGTLHSQASGSDLRTPGYWGKYDDTIARSSLSCSLPLCVCSSYLEHCVIFWYFPHPYLDISERRTYMPTSLWTCVSGGLQSQTDAVSLITLAPPDTFPCHVHMESGKRRLQLS